MYTRSVGRNGNGGSVSVELLCKRQQSRWRAEQVDELGEQVLLEFEVTELTHQQYVVAQADDPVDRGQLPVREIWDAWEEVQVEETASWRMHTSHLLFLVNIFS